MNSIRYILRLCVAILFSVFGANVTFAMSMAVSDITYFQTEIPHFVQGDDAGFAVRAPPLAAANVTVTGGVTVVQGGAFALHGQETVAALFVFGGNFSAPNRTVSVESGKFDYLFGRVTSGTHNTARSQQIKTELARVGVHDTSAGRKIITDHHRSSR